MSAAEERREPGAKEAAVVPPPPGSIADTFSEVLPDIEFAASQGVLDVVLTVQREDIPQVMRAAKDDPRLAFDYLRCLTGIDQMDQGLEIAYNLYSFKHAHNVVIKTILPADDPQVATTTTVWNGALWHEREAHEMFGIAFQGHPDLRPLLLEEDLGYYPLLKSHPLAEIEESQEDFLKAAPPAAPAAPGAPAAPVDERTAKIALAQKKAEVMKKAREEARAKGLSPEDEKAFVQEALKAVEAEAAAPPAAAPAAPAAPADERAARIALAQKKAEVMKKAREEARAKGLSPEDEKAFVQEALKALEDGN